MDALFTVIWILVIFFIVIKVFKRASQTGKSSSSASHAHVMNKPMSASGAGKVYSGGISRSAYKAEKATHTLMEDRNNDWLAKQFQAERKALYGTNIMFGQQLEHRQVCDAQMLKEYHLLNCSAGGVDDPSFK